MFQEMADCCIKVYACPIRLDTTVETLQVYALEKVLNLKKDTATHVVFIDEAMKVHSWCSLLRLI
jgi:hypothetical protein